MATCERISVDGNIENTADDGKHFWTVTFGWIEIDETGTLEARTCEVDTVYNELYINYILIINPVNLPCSSINKIRRFINK